MSATALREAATALADQTPPPEPLHVAHESLAAALVAALRDLTVVEKGRTATIPTKDGKNYTYDFADIADVVKLTRPVLAKHGLVALTPIHDHGNGLACTVTLVHEEGERLDLGPFPFPHGQNAQATGSAVTYHRRYALVAALGMAAGDDDDGAKASKPPAEPEFVWTHNACKARLLELLDGDKNAAKEAWTLGHGGEQEPTAALADRLADEWRANQPEPDRVPVVEDPQ